MSELTIAETPPASRWRRLLRHGLWSALIGFAGLILLSNFLGGYGMAAGIEIIGVLFTGWWSFLKRTGPAIHGNSDLWLMSVVCVTVILGGAQWSLNWLARANGASDITQRRWPWKWTWCGVSGLGLVFLVGMSVGGIAHQIGWLVTDPSPMLERKGNFGLAVSEMRQLDGALQQAELESKGNIAEMRQLVWAEEGYFRQQESVRFRESYHVLLILNGEGMATGHLILPRDPLIRARVGGLYEFDGHSGDWERDQQLQALLEQHRPALFAL